MIMGFLLIGACIVSIAIGVYIGRIDKHNASLPSDKRQQEEYGSLPIEKQTLIRILKEFGGEEIKAINPYYGSHITFQYLGERFDADTDGNVYYCKKCFLCADISSYVQARLKEKPKKN